MSVHSSHSERQSFGVRAFDPNPNEPQKAGPFLFFTNIDLVVQAVVNWLFCFGHVLKPVREIGRIVQSAFGFWGGIACTIEFWGLFFISPGLVQVKDQTFLPRYH